MLDSIPYIIEKSKQLCNGGGFVFAAQGWSELVANRLVLVDGGYSLGARDPYIYITDGDSNEGLGVLTYSIHANSMDDTYIWVGFVYVNPLYRQQGIFRKLIEEVEKIANDVGVHYIEYGTMRNNQLMLIASEAIGYEQSSVTLRKRLQ